MSKRFTDTEKWKKQFIKSLSTVHKLFFLYLLDECDHAGIWHVEPEIAEIRLGEKIDLEEIKKAFNKHIVEFDNGEKWFIPYFIEFQYGTLNESVNAHKSVIDRLSKYNLIKNQQFMNSLRTVMDMDKDKAKDKDKDKDPPTNGKCKIKNIFIPPTLKEFVDFFVENGYKEETAKKAWRGYEVADWHDSRGNKIKNWKQKALHVWFKNEHKISNDDEKTPQQKQLERDGVNT